MGSIMYRIQTGQNIGDNSSIGNRHGLPVDTIPRVPAYPNQTIDLRHVRRDPILEESALRNYAMYESFQNAVLIEFAEISKPRGVKHDGSSGDKIGRAKYISLCYMCGTPEYTRIWKLILLAPRGR
jgi:hypothetical protein